VALRWQQVDLKAGCLDVHRFKHGHYTKHPLCGPQLRLLRELQRIYPDSPYVFVSERKAPLSPRLILRLWREWGGWQGCHLSPTRTNCGMRVDITSGLGGMIRELFRIIWGTRIFNIRCAIPRWRPTNLKAAGTIKLKTVRGR
jgi:hypothetical protein